MAPEHPEKQHGEDDELKDGASIPMYACYYVFWLAAWVPKSRSCGPGVRLIPARVPRTAATYSRTGSGVDGLRN